MFFFLRLKFASVVALDPAGTSGGRSRLHSLNAVFEGVEYTPYRQRPEHLELKLRNRIILRGGSCPTSAELVCVTTLPHSRFQLNDFFLSVDCTRIVYANNYKLFSGIKNNTEHSHFRTFTVRYFRTHIQTFELN